MRTPGDPSHLADRYVQPAAASSVHRPDFSTLQAGRGLAAMLVVLFHATGLFASENYWNVEIMHGLFSFGHAGVEFFFSLSGFIMILVHHQDMGHSRRLYSFLRKRAVRIYPIYWVITLCVFALYTYTGNDRSRLISNSIVLIGRNEDAILAVAWTLFHEVLFYLAFGLIILNRAAGAAVFALWFVACLSWTLVPAPHYSLSAINVIFGFGMAAALAYRRIPNPVLVLAMALAAFLATGLEEVYLGLLTNGIRTLAYGATATIGIAAAVGAEAKGQLRSPRWMTALGDSSYSLYLVHYPVLAAASQLLRAGPFRSLPPMLAFAGVVAAATIAGFATHLLVEKKLLALIQRK